MSNPTVRLALLAGHDRSGMVELAQELIEFGYYIVSAGATAHDLSHAGVKIVTVERLSATPEVLDGAIRMLHPALMAGISARRDRSDHIEMLGNYRVGPVDFVAVNLAPPAETGEPLIDLNGAATLLAGANNSAGVAVLCDPADYPRAMAALRAGELTVEVRQGLAIKALAHVVERVSQASQTLGGPAFGETVVESAPAGGAGADLVPTAVLWQAAQGPEQVQLLADVREQWLARPTLGQLQGAPLTADLVIDADAAWSALCEFGDALPTAVVSRAGVVCGASVLAMSLAGAVLRAIDTDPLASHLATVAVNRAVDLGAMRALLTKTLTLIIAPSFDDEAVELAANNPELRLLTMGAPHPGALRRRLKATHLGVLQQDVGTAGDQFGQATTVTHVAPDEAQFRALAMAWRVAAHQPRCSAVACDEHGTVGISSGLANVGDALVVAIGKCRRSYKPLAVAVDTPLFGRENLEPLVKAGVHALVVACDELPSADLIAAAEAQSIRVVCVPRTPKL